MSRIRSLLLLPVAAAVFGVPGCGNPGSPLPPSLMLPEPVTDLSAARTGGAVSLHWTMTRATTDHVVLKGDQRAAICRVDGLGPCVPAGMVLALPGTAAGFVDTLPAALQEGPTRLLRYEVHLENRRGRDAGPSNPAYSAAGWAPPTVEQAKASATAKGILIRWQTAATHPLAPETIPNSSSKAAPEPRLLVRLVRDEVVTTGKGTTPGKQEVQAGIPQPVQQTLEALEHAPSTAGGPWLPEQTLDAGVALNRRYRYTVRMVEQLKLGGHALEMDGTPTTTPILDARDVFPPAVPAGVVAVANPQGGTIDLSWTPDASTDLAGYFVYRRVAGTASAPLRVSGKQPVTAPAWSDTHVQRGVRYAYSVSAIDTSGNESGRSTKSVEALPMGSE